MAAIAVVASWVGSCLPDSQFRTVWAVTLSSSATACWVSPLLFRAARSCLPRPARAAFLAVDAMVLMAVFMIGWLLSCTGMDGAD